MSQPPAMRAPVREHCPCEECRQVVIWHRDRPQLSHGPRLRIQRPRRTGGAGDCGFCTRLRRGKKKRKEKVKEALRYQRSNTEKAAHSWRLSWELGYGSEPLDQAAAASGPRRVSTAPTTELPVLPQGKFVSRLTLSSMTSQMILRILLVLRP